VFSCSIGVEAYDFEDEHILIAELNCPVFSGRPTAKLTAILEKKKALEQETEVVNLLEQEV
jgi:hypothetical protein